MKSIFCLLFCIQLCFAINVDVKTSSGLVRGRTIQVLNRSIDEFIGIPYAKPPIGELRFRKPEPIVKPLEGVIYAVGMKDSCIQPFVPNLTFSEDCLFLNVWTPKPKDQKSTELKPVMFWIHGGGLVVGSSFQYNGSALSAQDVVIVSTNYRLGPLGFIYAANDSAPGNAGLYDQVLALKWVRENIHLFGGDKDQITIFGQSAGSWSVSSHLLSPQSKGLFKRAIMESGAQFFNKDRQPVNTTETFENSIQFAKSINCTDSQHWLDCLRTVDAKNFEKNFEPVFPLIGTDFLPLSAQKAFQNQEFNKDIDIMAGVTRDEGSMVSYFSFPELYHDLTENIFRDLVNKSEKLFHNFNVKNVSDFYLTNVNTSDSNALKWAFYRLFGDLYIMCPTYKFAKSYLEHSPKSNLYFYEITYQRTDISYENKYGVTHGAEVDFVFGLPLIQPKPTDTETDIEFSKVVMKIWTDFAKNGKPTNVWPKLFNTEDKDSVHKIQDLNPNKMNHIFETLFNETCDGLWKYYY